MAQEKLCSKCAAPVSDEVAGGFCSACLLEEGLRPIDQDETSTSSKNFGDYELIEEIARGGMGVVFKARQRSLNRTVAVKMILSGQLASETEAQRFRTEAETAAQLQHSNIVAIHEVGEQNGQPYFSMDFVKGQNLAQLVREGPLPSRKAATYLKTIAEAVQYAHSQGVLHRDLKPSNILIDENDQPRVTDFGLAKRLTDPQLSTNDPQLTQTGQVLGSPSFIPPEQAAGQKDKFGPASDVYSLGAILYHCLTGRPPFVAETLTQTLRMVAEQEPVSPRLLNTSVPRDLETICLKCLEKDPGRRYTTAQELIEELGRFFRGEPIQARPLGVILKVHRWCLRNKALAIAGTTILGLLLVVAIGSPIALIRIDAERKQSEKNAKKEEQQRLRAEANAKQANSEAAKSRQVAQFLKEMLRSAGPSAARGRDATIVREILEATSARVSSELKDQPQVQGDMYSTIGNTFMDIGEHRRAITNFEQAVTSYHLAFQGDNRNLAITLSVLGFCQSFTGEVAQGNKNARLGVEMARRCGDQEILSTCLLHYSGSFSGWGMHTAESEPYVREAYDLKKQLGDDPVGLAYAMHSLSGFLTNAEDNEKMLQDSLDLYRKQLPPEHPRIAQGLFSLGQLQFGMDHFEEAEGTLRKARDSFRRIHNPNHPYQPIVLRFLAEALLLQWKGDEAESLVREQLLTTPTHAGYQDLLRRLLTFRKACDFDFALVKEMGVGGDFLMRDWPMSGPEIYASSLAQRGEWKEAAAAFAQNIELHPDQFENYRLLAPILLFTGDVEGYRKVCVQLVNRFKATVDPIEADRTAKVSLLRFDSGVDLDVAASLADTAVERGGQSIYHPWFELQKALAEFRQKHFASAVDWAEKALRSSGQVERDANAYAVLAMAQWQLKQDGPARIALAKADELVNEKLPKLGGDYIGNWPDVLGAHILLREAKALIQDSSPTSGN